MRPKNPWVLGFKTSASRAALLSFRCAPGVSMLSRLHTTLGPLGQSACSLQVQVSCSSASRQLDSPQRLDGIAAGRLFSRLWVAPAPPRLPLAPGRQASNLGTAPPGMDGRRGADTCHVPVATRLWELVQACHWRDIHLPGTHHRRRRRPQWHSAGGSFRRLPK